MPSSEPKAGAEPNPNTARQVHRPVGHAIIAARRRRRRPYLAVLSNFNWPIRHPSTNLIINIERRANDDDDDDISWLRPDEPVLCTIPRW